MQKLALEQVAEAEAQGVKRMQAAVEETRMQGEEALALAVAKARQEEQQKAAEERIALLRYRKQFKIH